MSDNKNNNPPETGQSDTADSNIASPSEVSSVTGSVKTSKVNTGWDTNMPNIIFAWHEHWAMQGRQCFDMLLTT